MSLLFVLTLWALPAAIVFGLQAWDAYEQARWEYEEMARHRAMQDALRGMK